MTAEDSGSGTVSDLIDAVDRTAQELVETLEEVYGHEFDEGDLNRLKGLHSDVVEDLDAAVDADPTNQQRAVLGTLDDLLDVLAILLRGIEQLEEAEAKADRGMELLQAEELEEASKLIDEADALVDPGQARVFATTYELQDLDATHLNHFDITGANQRFAGIQEWSRFLDWLLTANNLLARGLVMIEDGAAVFEEDGDIQRGRELIEEGSDLITASSGTLQHILHLDTPQANKQVAQQQLALVEQANQNAELLEDALRVASQGNEQRAEELFNQVE
jgi:hypothetical protein